MDAENTGANFKRRKTDVCKDVSKEKISIDELQDQDVCLEIVAMPHPTDTIENNETAQMAEYYEGGNIHSEVAAMPYLIIIDPVMINEAEDRFVLNGKFYTFDAKTISYSTIENIFQNMFKLSPKLHIPAILNNNFAENSPQETSDIDVLQDKAVASKLSRPYSIESKIAEDSDVDDDNCTVCFKSKSSSTAQKVSKVKTDFIVEYRKFNTSKSDNTVCSQQEIVNTYELQDKDILSKGLSCSPDRVQNGDSVNLKDNNCTVGLKIKSSSVERKISAMLPRCILEVSKYLTCNNYKIEGSVLGAVKNDELEYKGSPSKIAIIPYLLDRTEDGENICIENENPTLNVKQKSSSPNKRKWVKKQSRCIGDASKNRIFDCHPMKHSAKEAASNDFDSDSEYEDVVTEIEAVQYSLDRVENNESNHVKTQSRTLNIKKKLSSNKRNLFKTQTGRITETNKDTVFDSHHMDNTLEVVASDDFDSYSEYEDVVPEIEAVQYSLDRVENDESSFVETRSRTLNVKGKSSFNKRNFFKTQSDSNTEANKDTVFDSHPIDNTLEEVASDDSDSDYEVIFSGIEAMQYSLNRAEYENNYYTVEDETYHFNPNSKIDVGFLKKWSSCSIQADTNRIYSSSLIEHSEQSNIFYTIANQIPLEFRDFAKTVLSLMTGFCIGLFYGLGHSYADISMSDVYCAVYFAIYLILYLLFF